MKKLILAAVAVFAMGNSAFAQQEIKFGPKAGVNFANISGDDNAEMKTAFHVGMFLEFKLDDSWSIQPEVLYSSQGAKTSYTVFGQTLESDITADYVNIPVMAKYYVAEGFSIEAGPQIGFLMNAKAGDQDVKDSYKSMDISGNVGVNYDFPMGLFINARYSHGFTKINEDVTVAGFTAEAPDYKNSVIQVGVGYKF